MPVANKVTQVSPDDFVPLASEGAVPRLFPTTKAANVVLGMWLKGKATRSSKDDWASDNTVSTISYQRDDDRLAADYTICPVRINFDGEYERE